MNFDMHKILLSKRAVRRELAARPVAEKLRMLDVLRERELAIRGRTAAPVPCMKKPRLTASSARPPSPHEAMP